MKKGKITRNLFLSILFLIGLVLISGCNVTTDTAPEVESIDLLKFINFSELGTEIIRTYHKEKDIDAILQSINHGEKVDYLGQVDFARGDFCIKINYKNHASQGYYFIINKHENALFIDANNPSIGYDVQKDDVDKLADMLY